MGVATAIYIKTGASNWTAVPKTIQNIGENMKKEAVVTTAPTMPPMRVPTTKADRRRRGQDTRVGTSSEQTQASRK